MLPIRNQCSLQEEAKQPTTGGKAHARGSKVPNKEEISTPFYSKNDAKVQRKNDLCKWKIAPLFSTMFIDFINN